MPRQQQAQVRPLTDTDLSDSGSEVVQFTLRLPPVIHLMMKNLAEERELSLNKMIVEACRQALSMPGGAESIRLAREKLIVQGDHGEQAWAAIAYLLNYLDAHDDAARAWPWTQAFPGLGGAHDLIKAGGLVAAEIDRWQDGPGQQPS